MAFLGIPGELKVTKMPWFGNLNPKSRDFKSTLGGCKIDVINGELFSKTDRNDPQPDPSVQPKAWGLLHMEREYIAHHIRRRNSGLEHLIASMQPGKYSEDYSRRSKDSKPEQWIPEALDGHIQKYSTSAGLDYEELGGLSDSG